MQMGTSIQAEVLIELEKLAGALRMEWLSTMQDEADEADKGQYSQSG